MNTEPRKATEVLIELENKIDILLGIIRNQDLQMKVMSNKLTELLNRKQIEAPKITMEAVNTMPINMAPPQMQLDPERNIMISPEDGLPMEEKPSGFRRTSRPETFAGDDAYLNKNNQSQFTMRMPKVDSKEAEITVNTNISNKQPQPQRGGEKLPIQQQHTIPIIQRIVDGKGKSVFLADINIVDLTTNQSIFKTRTNGTGKWQASLPIGEYHITINKMESLNKTKIEAAQDVRIDGSQSQISLPMMIIK